MGAALPLTDADFYSRPCGRGDDIAITARTDLSDFYSRPCGRGDTVAVEQGLDVIQFLLTPLREGRQQFSTSPS